MPPSPSPHPDEKTLIFRNNIPPKCTKSDTIIMGTGSSSLIHTNNNYSTHFYNSKNSKQSPSDKTLLTTTRTPKKLNNVKCKEIKKFSLSELKTITTYCDSFGNLYFNTNLINEFSKEITILLTYSIHDEYISNISAENIDEAIVKFISIGGQPQNNLEEFLSHLKLLHLSCLSKQKASDNYLHLFTQTVATCNGISLSELIDSVKIFVDESPKYVSLSISSKKRKLESNEKTTTIDSCLTRINESLFRAEKYLKTSKTEVNDCAVHLLDVAPSPFVQFYNNSTTDTSTTTTTSSTTNTDSDDNKFLFPFRGDVLELDKHQFPTLHEYGQETKLAMQQDLVNDGKLFGVVPSIEKGMEFCVRFTCEQLTSTGQPLPVHLQKLLNYFDEIDSLSKHLLTEDPNVSTIRNVRHVANVSDLILNDPFENKMKLMHPYYQYYYYHYYVSLYNSIENEIPESTENPFLSMAPPTTKPSLNRPLFGRRVVQMRRNIHPDETTPSPETFSAQEFGFPYNISRNNLQSSKEDQVGNFDNTH